MTNLMDDSIAKFVHGERYRNLNIICHINSYGSLSVVVVDSYNKYLFGGNNILDARTFIDIYIKICKEKGLTMKIH